jgi:hypothetical protein
MSKDRVAGPGTAVHWPIALDTGGYEHAQPITDTTSARMRRIAPVAGGSSPPWAWHRGNQEAGIREPDVGLVDARGVDARHDAVGGQAEASQLLR